MYDAILEVIYEIQFLWSAGVRESAKNEKITEPYYSISSTNYDSHMNFVGLT